MAESRITRPISWIKAALKDFQEFPDGAQSTILAALTIAAEGGKADIAKPLHGFGLGVLEIVLAFRSDAYRVVYAVQLADEVWVIHDLIKDRLKRLKEALR
jgi:phage-related protein